MLQKPLEGRATLYNVMYILRGRLPHTKTFVGEAALRQQISEDHFLLESVLPCCPRVPTSVR